MSETKNHPLAEPQYTERFVKHMMAEALRQFGIKEFPDDITVEEYAREVVKSHWDEYTKNPRPEDDAPEQDAEADIECWGDE